MAYNVKSVGVGMKKTQEPYLPTKDVSGADKPQQVYNQKAYTNPNFYKSNEYKDINTSWTTPPTPDTFKKSNVAEIKNPENNVSTRAYVSNWMKSNGLDYDDSDLTYNDATGETYLKGMNLGKVASIGNDGYSMMDRGQLDKGLNSVKDAFGNNVVDTGTQYDNAINLSLMGGQNANESARYYDQQYRDTLGTDPLETKYGKQIMSTYKAIGIDDGNNTLAKSGGGANIDSSSLASMTSAQEMRKLNGVQMALQQWNNTMAGIGDALNNTNTAYNNNANTMMNLANSISSNDIADRNQTDSTNRTNAEITGYVPDDVIKASNTDIWYRDNNGEYKLINEDIDYSRLANEAEARGDIDKANVYRKASEQKVISNKNYSQYADKIVPSTNIETGANRHDKDMLAQTAYYDDLKTKNQISQAFLDADFQVALEQYKASGDPTKLNVIGTWMNRNGYNVPRVDGFEVFVAPNGSVSYTKSGGATSSESDTTSNSKVSYDNNIVSQLTKNRIPYPFNGDVDYLQYLRNYNKYHTEEE